MPDVVITICVAVLGLAAWGGIDLAGRIGDACDRRAARRQAPEPMPAAEMDAMIDATRQPRPRPHPELAAARAGLCAADRYYAANLRTWLALQAQRDVIEANGRSLADYLRQALDGPDDLELARLTRAMLRVTPAYRHVDDPFAVYCDALAAAFLDLTEVERSTTP